MALDFGTTAGNVLRYLKGDNLVSDIDLGFQALAEDVASKMLGYSQDTFAKRPSAGTANRLFYATDTGVFYKDTGLAWYPIPLGGSAYASNSLNVANGNPSPGRGVTSAVWGATALLVTMSNVACTGKALRLKYRCGFIGVNFNSASAPIYGLRFQLLVDGAPVALRDGSTYIAYPLLQFSGQTPIAMFNPTFEFGYVPAAGTHSFGVQVAPDNAGASASVEGPHELYVAEY